MYRSQYVVLNGVCSPTLSVEGDQQGSGLAPLLFLFAINDIAQGSTCEIGIFADDVCLWCSNESVDDSCSLLNHELKRVDEWAVQSGFQFSVPKCSVTHFSRDKEAPVAPPIIHSRSRSAPSSERSPSIGWYSIVN